MMAESASISAVGSSIAQAPAIPRLVGTAIAFQKAFAAFAEQTVTGLHLHSCPVPSVKVLQKFETQDLLKSRPLTCTAQIM